MSHVSTAGIHFTAQDGQRYIVPAAQLPLPRRAYRVRDLVYMLGLAKSTVHDMISRGDLRAVAIGRGRRKILLVPAEEVERLLNPPTCDRAFDGSSTMAFPSLTN